MRIKILISLFLASACFLKADRNTPTKSSLLKAVERASLQIECEAKKNGGYPKIVFNGEENIICFSVEDELRAFASNVSSIKAKSLETEIRRLPKANKGLISSLISAGPVISSTTPTPKYTYNKNPNRGEKGLSPYDTKIKTRTHVSEILSEWESISTDPTEHNPKEYRYIVHALQPEDFRQFRALHFLLATVERREEISPGWRLNWLWEGNIFEKPLISCSLINERNNETFSTQGIILRVPAENILQTYPSDGGTPSWRGMDFVREILENEYRPLLLPERLLASRSMNEILITGTHPESGAQVEIIGVFIKKDSKLKEMPEKGQAEYRRVQDQLKDMAERLGVPVIGIK